MLWMYGWARKTGAICQVGVLTPKRCIFGPKTALGPTFDVYHVKRILVSKYEFGGIRALSLECPLFCQKAKESEKDIHCKNLKCQMLEDSLFGARKML